MLNCVSLVIIRVVFVNRNRLRRQLRSLLLLLLSPRQFRNLTWHPNRTKIGQLRPLNQLLLLLHHKWSVKFFISLCLLCIFWLSWLS